MVRLFPVVILSAACFFYVYRMTVFMSVFFSVLMILIYTLNIKNAVFFKDVSNCSLL